MRLDEFASSERAASDRPEGAEQLRPISFSATPIVRKPAKTSDIGRCAVIPDMQVGFSRNLRTNALEPFHDRAAIDVAWQIIEQEKLTDIVLLGDNLDLPEWSLKFTRSPEMYWTTQPSIVELGWWLAQLPGEVPIHYIEGNHEVRLRTTVLERAVAAYDLRNVYGDVQLSVETLLDLPGLGIEYHGPYPHGEVWLTERLRLHHGEVVRSKSGGTVRSIVDSVLHSEGIGHIHRFELAARTAWTASGPHINTAFSPGTLARIDPGAVPGATSRQNWQQGISICEFDRSSDLVKVDMIPIMKGRAIHRGKIFTARPLKQMVRQMEADTGFRLS